MTTASSDEIPVPSPEPLEQIAESVIKVMIPGCRVVDADGHVIRVGAACPGGMYSVDGVPQPLSDLVKGSTREEIQTNLIHLLKGFGGA